jgi:hypothetical protein
MFSSIRHVLRVFFNKLLNRQASNISSSEVHDLDQALTVLCHWGRPKLFRMPSGWYCFVDVGLNPEGTLITIDSNAFHASPTLAARECLARARTLHPKNLNTADTDMVV